MNKTRQQKTQGDKNITKQNETKTHKSNRTWSPFVWACGLPWRVICPTDTPLRKKWFSLSQQVSIANNFLGRAGASCLLPLPPSPCSMLWLCLLWACAGLEHDVSLCSGSSCDWKMLLSWTRPPPLAPGSSTVSATSSAKLSETCREVGKDILLREVLQSLYSLHIVQLEISGLITIFSEREPLWKALHSPESVSGWTLLFQAWTPTPLGEPGDPWMTCQSNEETLHWIPHFGNLLDTLV